MSTNEIKTEFEAFYHRLEKQFTHLPSTETDVLKSKLRRTCENYINVPMKTKYEKTIYALAKNKNIAILKQDKGRGVVIIDRSKYVEKGLSLINTPNFKKLEKGPTVNIERTVQDTLLKIKKAVGQKTYSEIYPSGSNPGKFYETGKVHKLNDDERNGLGNVDKLPLRPIISNIGTATYKTAKYLAKLLTPLGKSKYTVGSTKEFVDKLRGINPPKGYVMISFDVVSLFTNV